MKRVLVTGADGFIGSHLSEFLLEKGYMVRALSYYNSFNSWGWLEDFSSEKNLEIVAGDIRDPAFCNELVSDIDTIYHLAALIAIPYSYKAPSSYIETNVKGTVNICQAAKDSGNIRILHTSTSEVYGTARYTPIDEDHPRQPQSPYSASKIGADAVAMSYFNSFDLPLTIVRPFNTYGPRQSARAVIPSVITQIASGRTKINTGDLSPTRDFNFVGDICRGFLEIAESEGTIGKEINLASGREESVREVVKIISSIMNREIETETEQVRIRPERSEVFRLVGDNTLAKELAGWVPRTDLETGLRMTIDWFTKPENINRYKAGIFNY
ncbi:MAG: GDP-mannose 4,6-dehydratase [Bacteroidales bacterium]|nr:GDP-mannose 4,6-dehydratase [Bacteroidales bacterium]